MSERLFQILVEYDAANKLKLNKYKTSLLTLTMPRNKEAIKEVEIVLENEENVEPQNQIKVLGFLTNEWKDHFPGQQTHRRNVKPN